MSYELYSSLCQVNGFKNLNGNTYQEHIILILGHLLSEETKEKILNTKNIKDALDFIDVPYTHDMK